MSLKRYLLREQIVGPAVVNLFLNAGIAWAVFRTDPVPVWGDPGIAVDLAFTAFLYPFLLCLIVSLVARNDGRLGKAPHLSLGELRPRWLAALPERLLARSLVCGVLGLLIGWPLGIGLLKVTGVESVSRVAAIWGKGAMMALVAPWLAMAAAQRALCDSHAAPPQRQDG